MKKLLGIVVLGLLLSGNAYAKNYDCKFLDLKNEVEYYNVITDLEKNKVIYLWKFPLSSEQQVKANEITEIKDNIIFYDELEAGKVNYKKLILREDKDFPQTDGGTIYSYSKFKVGNNVEWVTHRCRKVNEIKNEVSLIDDKKMMINNAKKTCKELGFKDGTEKLADCALKLMTTNNLESETQNNIVSSSASTQDKQYTFTGDATFGTNKKSKKHNKKVAKYMKMPEEVLCIAYINNSGIFKKAKQAARTEALRTRGIDCNPYMDAAFYDKEKRKDGIAKAFRDLASDQGDIARENEERRARNKNKNMNCTSRVIGDRVSTSCY
tara:strand:+ start:396 stop:1367 length:972 start_codon:yes stop_codon:yes gene_type:complete